MLRRWDGKAAAHLTKSGQFGLNRAEITQNFHQTPNPQSAMATNASDDKSSVRAKIGTSGPHLV